jgi:hypothetical protein
MKELEEQKNKCLDDAKPKSVTETSEEWIRLQDMRKRQTSRKER